MNRCKKCTIELIFLDSHELYFLLSVLSQDKTLQKISTLGKSAKKKYWRFPKGHASTWSQQVSLSHISRDFICDQFFLKVNGLEEYEMSLSLFLQYLLDNGVVNTSLCVQKLFKNWISCCRQPRSESNSSSSSRGSRESMSWGQVLMCKQEANQEPVDLCYQTCVYMWVCQTYTRCWHIHQVPAQIFTCRTCGSCWVSCKSIYSTRITTEGFPQKCCVWHKHRQIRAPITRDFFFNP